MWHLKKHSRAFTFPELVLGMAITTLVTTAMAAFSFAMSKSWRVSEDSQSLQTASSQTMNFVINTLCTARYIGYSSAGVVDDASTDADDDSFSPTSQASIVFWKDDINGDERMQLEELAVLENVDGALRYYEYDADLTPTTPDDNGSLLGGLLGVVDATLDAILPIDLLGSGAVQDVKAWPEFSSPKVLATNVSEAAFTVDRGSSNSRPSVTMTMKFKRGSQSVIRVATATLRSPMEPHE